MAQRRDRMESPMAYHTVGTNGSMDFKIVPRCSPIAKSQQKAFTETYNDVRIYIYMHSIS